MIPTLVLFGGFLVFIGAGIPIPFALILSSLVVFLMNPATPAWVLAPRATLIDFPAALHRAREEPPSSRTDSSSESSP